MDVKLIKKIRATDDKGSSDLTRQIDESELALNTLKKAIHNFQEENKAYREENKAYREENTNLKQQIKNLERETEEMLLYP